MFGMSSKQKISFMSTKSNFCWASIDIFVDTEKKTFKP